MVNTKASPRAAAEAAAWVARLQGDARVAQTDAAFQDWLRSDPSHEEAFERATDIWSIIPGAMLTADDRPTAAARRRIARPPAFAARQLALAASLLLVFVVGATLWLARAPTYTTAIGEQKVTTLTDGSRIALNTDSSVRVRYQPGERRVDLDYGEAMFEVAHNTARPFIVHAGPKLVRAVGTSFIVRRTGDDVVVTLIQGKIQVKDTRSVTGRTTSPTVMLPGDRLTSTGDAPAKLDEQPADIATAWRRGQAMFSDMPLAAAAADLNRYGGPPLVIDDPKVGALRVSGVFATNDPQEFAQAVAALHNLRVEKSGDGLHLVR